MTLSEIQSKENRQTVKNSYLYEASDRFDAQLTKVFERTDDYKTTASQGLKMFFEFDVDRLNSIWRSSGLCTKSKFNFNQTVLFSVLSLFVFTIKNVLVVY